MSPGGIDREVVRRHLLALDHALTLLERHRGATAAELAEDRERLWIVERGLQLCAQNALDIATHIAAAAGRDVPDYATAIDRLAELKVLPADLARRLRGLAGFRNVLVHGYLDVDLEIVARALESRLDELAEFARRIQAQL